MESAPHRYQVYIFLGAVKVKNKECTNHKHFVNLDYMG